MRATVRSIPALRDLKQAVVKFQHETQSGLDAAQMEVHRVLAWIEQDRPAYWQAQLRRAFEGLAAARTALTTCQMRTVGGHRPACIEEKQAYEKAKRRLEHCQLQLRKVQQWAIKLQREADEFRARLSAARRLVEQELPSAAALLDRSLDALEAYAEIPQPSDAASAHQGTEPAKGRE